MKQVLLGLFVLVGVCGKDLYANALPQLPQQSGVLFAAQTVPAAHSGVPYAARTVPVVWLGQSGLPIQQVAPRVPEQVAQPVASPQQVAQPVASPQQGDYVISHQEYGKDKVKLLYVSQQGLNYTIKELELETSLSLNSELAFRDGDNRDIIATDSQKNTVYVLAKKHGVQNPEAFGILLAKHFVNKYPQVEKARITLKEHPWQRIVDRAGYEHNHAFVSTPVSTRVAEVTYTRSGELRVSAGIRGLTVLKTTQSSFVDFVDDEFRTLPDMPDRVFSTSVTADWDYSNVYGLNFDATFASIQDTMLEVFAGPADVGIFSSSVQQTQFLTQKTIMDRIPQVSEMTISMPNRHYFSVDFTKFPKIAEVQGEGAGDVLLPVDKPSGVITSTLSRAGLAATR